MRIPKNARKLADADTFEDSLIISVRLAAKFAKAICCAEGQRIYIRYANGREEYLTKPQAMTLLR